MLVVRRLVDENIVNGMDHNMFNLIPNELNNKLIHYHNTRVI